MVNARGRRADDNYNGCIAAYGITMSLATCIRKAGKALDKSDADAIREIQQDYVSDGMTSTEAANKAIDEYLGLIAIERNSIVQQIEKQLGDTRSITTGTRYSKLGEANAIRDTETKRQTERREAAETKAQNSRTAEATAAKKDIQTRFNLTEKEVDTINENPSSSESRILKLRGSTQEEMVDVGAVKNAWSTMTEAARKATLDVVPRRALVDFLDGVMAKIGKEHLDLHYRMEGRKAELEQEIEKIVKPWHKFNSKNKEAGQRLADIMHAATLAGANPDPQAEYVSSINVAQSKAKLAKLREGVQTDNKVKQAAVLETRLQQEAIRRKQHMFLQGQFNKLGKAHPEAIEIFRKVLNFNEAAHALVLESMENRIAASEADGASKTALRDLLRKKFESSSIKGPYFSLGRSGKHWAAAKILGEDGKPGEVQAYSKFDTRAELESWAEQWRQEKGIVIESGEVSLDELSDLSKVDPGFVESVQNLLSKSDANESLRDEIWQMYLKTLPEMSARTAFIHRKNRLGFSGDALRSFTVNQFKNSHAIAKLEYAHEITKTLHDLNKTAQQVNLDDPWAVATAKEFTKRHTYAMNPPNEVIVAKIMAFGFHFYLGFNPSTALVNGTQTWIMGTSILGAAHGGGVGGFAKAVGELSKASGHVLDPRTIGLEDNPNLTEDEQAAFREFSRIYLFDKTQSSDLIGAMNDSGPTYSAAETFSKYSALMFHNVEVYNRRATALAAYRMARERNQNHEEAILTAEHLTWDAHFDYSNTNRPRVMQQGLGRVAFMFKNYSVNVGYRLGRDFVDTWKGKDRKAAASRLIGTVAMTGLLSGVRGLPFIWMAMGIASVISDVFSEGGGDEPYDVEGDIRSTLTELTGSKEISHAIMDGPIDALTGLTLSNRVSLSNLVYRDQNKELLPDEVLPAFLLEASGAFLGGVLPNIGKAWKDLDEGRGDLALKRVSPVALKNWLKADTYYDEGSVKRDGTVVFDPEEFTRTEIAGQALGFTPTKVGLEFKRSNIAYSAKKKLSNRSAQIRKRILNAEARGTEVDEAEAWAEFDAFNEKQKDFRDRITFKSIGSARKSRWKNINTSERGMAAKDRARVEDTLGNF